MTMPPCIAKVTIIVIIVDDESADAEIAALAAPDDASGHATSTRLCGHTMSSRRRVTAIIVIAGQDAEAGQSASGDIIAGIVMPIAACKGRKSVAVGELW